MSGKTRQSMLVMILGGVLISGVRTMNAEKYTHRERSIVEIACHTAMGALEPLKVALTQALNEGTLIINEIKEILVQMYAYCGFPRSLNAIVTFNEIVD